jgi:hypothetical protein
MIKERQSEWAELRQKVYYQEARTWETYPIDGNLRGAAASVRQLARKYKFKVYTTGVSKSNVLVVYKESEPINGNSQS